MLVTHRLEYGLGMPPIVSPEKLFALQIERPLEISVVDVLQEPWKKKERPLNPFSTVLIENDLLDVSLGHPMMFAISWLWNG